MVVFQLSKLRIARAGRMRLPYDSVDAALLTIVTSFAHIRDIKAFGSTLGAEIAEGVTPMELRVGRSPERPGLVGNDLTGRPYEPAVLRRRHITCRYRLASRPAQQVTS